MRIRTEKHGDLEILLQGNLKTPYPELERKIVIDNDEADVKAVSNTITCRKDGKIYKGYHIYLLKEIIQEVK